MGAPSFTRVWFVRHGRVDASYHGRLYGTLDVPLSDEGREQARTAAAVLDGERLDGVLSSGYQRAEFGARLLREPRGLARRDQPAFREIDRGAWAGLTFAELEAADPGALAAWWESPSERRPPEGENLRDVADRVLPALDAVLQEHAGGAVAIVAHSWVIRIAAADALGLPPEGALALDLHTAGICAIDYAVGDASPPLVAGWALDAPPPTGPFHQGP